ncbi:MAG: DUF4384 domain-containing protein [Spirochaetaceae bacterium]|jgi:hypothetical protein|nr:DUF4384 domain-containing protein [Spirochaetaceae bacterium]
MNGVISELLLERYRLGEVTRRERRAVDAALKADSSTGERFLRLDESDRELRNRIARGDLLCTVPASGDSAGDKTFLRGSVFSRRGPVWGLAAAALICLLFPVLYITLGQRDRDRPKGAAVPGAELSLYVNRDTASGPLGGNAALKEGDTVQLAYTVPRGERYGVIFSIDSRAVVTLHYPYSPEQSSLLASGRRAFLDEAYILDDAPDFEMFFMVLSPDPLDTAEVLAAARNLAPDPPAAASQSKTVFEGCDVKTLVIRKK